MNNNTSFDITEFETLMSLDNPIKSSQPARWERKARQQQQQQASDRYIPNRSGMDYDLNQKNSLNDENFDKESNDSSEASEHAKLIMANAADQFDGSSSSKGSRVLAFKNKAPAPAEGYQNTLKVLYSTQSVKKGEVVKPTRHIASAPVRVLDAPDMLDDYCKFVFLFCQLIFCWNFSTSLQCFTHF